MSASPKTGIISFFLGSDISIPGFEEKAELAQSDIDSSLDVLLSQSLYEPIAAQ